MCFESRKSVAWVAVLALVVVGCQTKSPEERIAETRSKYVAELNSWIVRDAPVTAEVETVLPGEGGEQAPAAEEELEEGAVPEAGAGEDEAAEGGPEGEGADEGAEEATQPEPAGPRTRDVVLDIDLYHTAAEPLPGITLDVTQADSQEREKAVFNVWVDTSNLVKGQHIQVNEILEDVEFEPGDLFSVEVRHPVPPEDRSEYREFSAVE